MSTRWNAKIPSHESKRFSSENPVHFHILAYKTWAQGRNCVGTGRLRLRTCYRCYVFEWSIFEYAPFIPCSAFVCFGIQCFKMVGGFISQRLIWQINHRKHSLPIQSLPARRNCVPGYKIGYSLVIFLNAEFSLPKSHEHRGSLLHLNLIW